MTCDNCSKQLDRHIFCSTNCRVSFHQRGKSKAAEVDKTPVKEMARVVAEESPVVQAAVKRTEKFVQPFKKLPDFCPKHGMGRVGMMYNCGCKV